MFIFKRLKNGKKSNIFFLKSTTNFGVSIAFLCRKNSECDFEKRKEWIIFVGRFSPNLFKWTSAEEGGKY